MMIKAIRSYKNLLFIGALAILIFVFSSPAVLDNLFTKGPDQSLAEFIPCDIPGFDGCPEPGGFSDTFPTIPGITDQPAAPAPAAPQAPIPACTDDVRYCDSGRTIHKTGGYYDPNHSLADSRGCVYAFVPEGSCGQPAQPAAPAPAAPQGGGQACTPGEWSAVSCSRCNAQGTGMNADGSDWGSYDGQWGSWCGCGQKFSTLQGKAFNSSNYPQCGGAPAGVPSPVQPQPAPVQPAPQPVPQPVPFTPAIPAPAGAPLPACDTLANNIVCGGQRAYDTCHEFTQGGVKFLSCVASQNSNCTGIIQCSQPVSALAPQAPTQTQTADQRAQCPSGTTTVIAQNNVITCINNSNQQQQSQTQNNNQVINIPGGIVTRTEIIREQPVAIQVARVDCPTGTVKKVVDREVICEVTSRPIATVAGAKELPKTGLPAVAWAIGAFVPLGMKLRRFSKFSANLLSTPGYIWEDRQFKK